MSRISTLLDSAIEDEVARNLVLAMHRWHGNSAPNIKGRHIATAMRTLPNIEVRARRLLVIRSGPERVRQTLRPLVALCANAGEGFDYIRLGYDLTVLIDPDQDSRSVMRAWGRHLHNLEPAQTARYR